MTTIRCYDPKGNDGGIHSWYATQDGAMRGAIDAALELLILEDDWEALPYVEDLHNLCEGLTEIKIDIPDGRLVRILGFYGPKRADFTLLFGFDKTATKDAAYGPACHSAHWRMKGVIRNARRAAPCQFP